MQTAWPPSCLYPRFARAPFSVTHASPSPAPCPGLCIARLRRSAGAAPALPWTPEQRRVSVRERLWEGRRAAAAGGGAALPAFGGDLTSLARPLLWFGPACPPPCCVLAGPAALAAAALAGSVRLVGPARGLSPIGGRRRRGGLARDWSVAGRPRTWHLIGRAVSGLGGD